MGTFCVILEKEYVNPSPPPKKIQNRIQRIRPDLNLSCENGKGFLFISLDTEGTIHTTTKRKALNQNSFIVCTGDVRIDNRIELMSFYSIDYFQSDIDLIIELYLRNGIGFVHRLLGDFAFALWDSRNATLYSVRDQVGVRPVFYYDSPSHLCISSDIEALLILPYVSINIDEVVVANWFAREINGHPENTFYKNIKRLLPAYVIEYTSGKSIQLRRYFSWDSVEEQTQRDYRDFAAELRDVFQKAIECRLSPTAPIGSHLSGGIDSSSVTVMLNRILSEQGRELKAFSWSPSPDRMASKYAGSEYDCIESICNNQNITCYYNDPHPEDILEAMAVNVFNYPMFFPLDHKVLQKIKSMGITQIFTGWGGDEGISFDGRSLLPDLLRKGRGLTLVKELFLQTKRSELPDALRFSYSFLLTFYNKVLKFFPPFTWIKDPVLYQSLDKHLADVEKRLPGAVDVKRLKELLDDNSLVKPGYSECATVHETQKQLIQKGGLACRCEDWALKGLRSGISFEFPLLDRRIITLSLQVPSHLFLNCGWRRWFFRQSMNDILPENVVWRKSTKSEPNSFYNSEPLKYQARQLFLKKMKAETQNNTLHFDWLHIDRLNAGYILGKNIDAWDHLLNLVITKSLQLEYSLNLTHSEYGLSGWD